MRRVRVSWAIITLVVLVTLAVRPLRDLAQWPHLLRPDLTPFPALDFGESGSHYRRGWGPVDSLWQQARIFAEQHGRKEPELLAAAGLLEPKAETAVSLLKYVAESSHSPMAWAAYFTRTMELSPRWARPGVLGRGPGGPGLPGAMGRTAARGVSVEGLSEAEVAPYLRDLRTWEEVDPRNALPVALEAYWRYAAREDARAFACWKAAAARPVLTEYADQLTVACVKLFERMGYSHAQAEYLVAEYGTGPADLSGRLEAMGRVAVYEGRAAQRAGRPADAIAWWEATRRIGLRMAADAPSVRLFDRGVSLQRMGASPAWHSRTVFEQSGLFGVAPDHPSGGRLRYGPQHAFFVSQVGGKADAEVRQSLLLAMARMGTVVDHLSELRYRRTLYRAGTLADMAQAMGVTAAGLALLALLASRRRRAEEGGARPHSAWRAVLALVIVLPAIGGVLLAEYYLGEEPMAPSQALFGGAVASVVFALSVPALVPAGQRLFRVAQPVPALEVRRMLLPTAAALAAVLALGLAVSSAVTTESWARRRQRSAGREIDRVIAALGKDWTDPKIPAEAWRAEYPALGERR